MRLPFTPVSNTRAQHALIFSYFIPQLGFEPRPLQQIHLKQKMNAWHRCMLIMNCSHSSPSQEFEEGLSVTLPLPEIFERFTSISQNFPVKPSSQSQVTQRLETYLHGHPKLDIVIKQ